MTPDPAGRDPFSLLLYPMLTERPTPPASVVAELAAAPLQKLAETERLQRAVVDSAGTAIVVAARGIADRMARGGRVLTCGNGGSATSAADLVADLASPDPPHRPLPGVCLSEDVSVISAIANDVGFDEVFARQVIAFGRRDDVLVVVSTSGNSANLVRAATEARGRGLLTVGLSGDGGGRLATDGALDHCLTVPSSSVHRIQEVQTTVQHLLIEIIHRILEGRACA